jgi:hypothetical protein
MQFNRYYAVWTAILFFVELGIALFVDDDFIRPYVGDVLVVILIYAFVRAFFKVAIVPAALGVWVFAFGVEILQYFNIVELLGWEASAIARTVIGTTFDGEDLVAYTLGIGLILGSEKLFGPHKQEWTSLH